MAPRAEPGRPEEPDLYASPPPWDIGRPQPAFLGLARAGLIRGRVLDAGCGTGEHTLMAAGLGLDATGADGWRVDAIEPATIDITTGPPSGIRAWLAALTRT